MYLDYSFVVEFNGVYRVVQVVFKAGVVKMQMFAVSFQLVLGCFVKECWSSLWTTMIGVVTGSKHRSTINFSTPKITAQNQIHHLSCSSILCFKYGARAPTHQWRNDRHNGAFVLWIVFCQRNLVEQDEAQRG